MDIESAGNSRFVRLGSGLFSVVDEVGLGDSCTEFSHTWKSYWVGGIVGKLQKSFLVGLGTDIFRHHPHCEGHGESHQDEDNISI